VGNRTKRTDKSTNEVMEYRWDIRDRLTGITVKNDLGEIIRTAEYTYDVYNQRIAKTVDTDGDGSLAAVTERFVYGRDQNIALVFDENGNVNHRYLFGDGVDQIEADESNGTVLWALTDHLGSVRDVVDDSGTVLNHVVYDAFGGVTSQTDESVVFRYGYTAREFDAESGLQYNRARYLDSFTGKFISEDPISFKGGDFNLYRYVFNSPLNGTDPSGEVTVYDALNAADQFSGSFSRVVTFGATDYIREKIYGNDVNKNQTGTFANLGTGAGVVTSFLLGGSAPRALVGVTNLERLAKAHTVIGTGLGAYQSTKNILNGCATPWDILPFVPLVGFGGSVAWKGFTQPSNIGAIDAWLAGGSKGGIRRDLAAQRLNFSRNNSKVYYTVQNGDDATRLFNGGQPWPNSPTRAHLGEGLYTWGNRSDAQSYLNRLTQRGADVSIFSFRISNDKLQNLRTLDLRPPVSDEAANEWLSLYSSLYGKGLKHDYQHVIREATVGTEHYFQKDVFSLFRMSK
jgi:RHS repeat-associated protein